MQSLPTAVAFPIILVAGILGQKLAAKIWSLAVGEDPPDTAQEDVRLLPLLGAAVIEGTLYKLLRMLADRGLRQAVSVISGNWPGATGEGE
jgi:uncharacterized protein YidB (DUF937 family)